MSIELIVLIGAFLVSWLVFKWLLDIVKTTLKTALAIAAIILILQLGFGIGWQDLWQQIVNLPQTIQDFNSNQSDRQ